MKWLGLLALLPTLVSAECKAPTLKNVRVLPPNVSWTGSFEPSCLRGFEVCWTSPMSRDESCEMAPPDNTSLIIGGYQPCVMLNVQVTALAKGNLTSSVLYGYGEAGPPEISGFKAVQQSRDMTVLQWTSLENYMCVDSVWLWVCENETQDRSTCISAKLNSHMSRFEVYALRVCRYYYAYACTQELYEKPYISMLQLYLDSANELTSVEVTGVTQDSATVQWRISDANFTCKTEKMRICYQEQSNETSPECWSWAIGQPDKGDSLTLTDLYTCTTYWATVSLRTAGKYSHQTISFTTPMNSDVIEAKVSNVTNTEALVTWSFDADKVDCNPDNMLVCYSIVGNNASRMCRSLGTGLHSSVRLHNLAVCTAYEISLTLLTSASPKPSKDLKLATLSTGRPVLVSLNTTVVNTTVRAEWTHVNASMQCVAKYNVSWYSSGDPRKSWQTLPTNRTSFDIFGVSFGQTYFVQVSAVFVDGTMESLLQHVDIPAHSGSSRSFQKISSSLLLLITVSLIKDRW